MVNRPTNPIPLGHALKQVQSSPFPWAIERDSLSLQQK